MRLSNPQMLTANAFKFRASATEHAAYVIEYSSSFTTWNPLLTNSGSLLNVTNAAAGVNFRTRNSVRFHNLPKWRSWKVVFDVMM
jgi:hypothetical protein